VKVVKDGHPETFETKENHLMNTKSVLALTLLCSTAVTPLAQAQDARGGEGMIGQRNASNTACTDLQRISEENAERFQQAWIDNADVAVEVGDPTQCAVYVERAEAALEEAQTRGDESAETKDRIIVEQPEPTVTVQQPAPEITVSAAEPEVTVNQGQPEIIVRQAEPTVRVHMPQPTITIDQPEPEIIVRMPEPDVNVRSPEPQVDVSQSEPRVSVEQQEPEIAVREGDEAQVNVRSGEPVIARTQRNDDGSANVQIERAEPRIRYERAEPNIELTSEGEPQIEFSQSGEPQISMERSSDDRPAAEQANQRQARTLPNEDEQQGDASRQSAQSSEQSAESNERQSVSSETRQAVAVSEIIGRDVYNARDNQLGTVDRLVSDGEDVFAILAHGGFLGLGEREVALPFDRLSMHDERDVLILRGMTQDEIRDLPPFDANGVRELRRTQEIDMSSL
jgi:hypothetical protein